jgi:HEAT repeat protein
MLNVLSPEAVSLPALAAALEHKDYFVRYNAAELLGRRADRAARLIIQEILARGTGPARASAALFIHGFSWFTAQALYDQALNDSDSRVREAAIYSLCELQSYDAFQRTVAALQAEVDHVREAAAWGLRNCQDPGAVPVLEAVLLADDPEVRVKALESLGTNGQPEAVPVVRRAIDDPHPDVRYAATLSYLELLEEAALGELAEIISHYSGEARQAILRGFFHATNYLHIDIRRSDAGEAVIEALALALTDENPEVRMAAAWPLVWIKDQRSDALLNTAYEQETDQTVKAHYLYVALNLLSPIGPGLLQDGLSQAAGPVRQIAEQLSNSLQSGEVVI